MIDEKIFKATAQKLALYDSAAKGLHHAARKEASLDVLTHASMMLDQTFLDGFDDYVAQSRIELEMALQSLVESCLDHIKNSQGFFMHASCLLYGSLTGEQRNGLAQLDTKSDLLNALLHATDVQIEAQTLESSTALRQVIEDLQARKLIREDLNVARLYIFDAEQKQTCLQNSLFLYLVEGDKIWASCKLSLLIIVALASGHDTAQQLEQEINIILNV